MATQSLDVSFKLCAAELDKFACALVQATEQSILFQKMLFKVPSHMLGGESVPLVKKKPIRVIRMTKRKEICLDDPA